MKQKEIKMHISFNCFEHCKHKMVAIRAISFETAVDSLFSDYSYVMKLARALVCYERRNIEHDL